MARARTKSSASEMRANLLATWQDAEIAQYLIAVLPPAWRRAAYYRRKARLLLCAGVRVAWPHLSARQRAVVATGEGLGDADPAVVRAALAALRPLDDVSTGDWAREGWCAALAACQAQPGGSADYFTDFLGNLPLGAHRRLHLTRDLLGEFFLDYSCRHCYRGSVPTDADDDTCRACGGTGGLPLAWRTPTVLAQAEAACDRPMTTCPDCNGVGQINTGPGDYGDEYMTCRCCAGARRVEGPELDGAAVAVLADALEEAGCANATLLDHLRREGPHYRGCWALELVRAKGGMP